MSDTRKVISLRLSPEQHAAAKWVAKSEGISLTEFILDAINFHVERKIKSPSFKRRLEERIAEVNAENEAHIAALRRLLE